MILIVDASVAVKWVVEEHLRDRARTLLDDAHELCAPDFVLVESASALFKKAKKQEISPDQASEGAAAIARYFNILHPAAELVERSMKIAFELDHSVYDCLYLACAEAWGGVVVTADHRFEAKASAKNLGYRIMRLEAMPDIPV